MISLSFIRPFPNLPLNFNYTVLRRGKAMANDLIRVLDDLEAMELFFAYGLDQILRLVKTRIEEIYATLEDGKRETARQLALTLLNEITTAREKLNNL
jgi:hypothetical protein